MPSKNSSRVASKHGAVAAWFVLGLFTFVVGFVLYGYIVLRVPFSLPGELLWVVGFLAMTALLYLFGFHDAVNSMARAACQRLGWTK